MVRFFAALLLLGALSAEAQIQTQPTGLKKMDGSDSGSGGSGWTYDAIEDAWIFTPPSGASDTRVLSDYIGLQDAAGSDIMALSSTQGATTYVAARLAAGALEVRGLTALSASGTITATNVQCSTGGGAVVGTLNATAGNVGRFVYVTRDGANTCTIGVTSGQTLDGVTDGTTTVPSAGWKTFVQTTPTAWVTAGSYPVTGTLSGLTAPFVPVAASGTTIANSDISYYIAKSYGAEPVLQRKLCFTDSAGAITCLGSTGSGYIGQGFTVMKGSAADSAYGEIHAGTIRGDGFQTYGHVSAASVGLYSSLYAGGALPSVALADGEEIGWPIGIADTQIKKDAPAVVGIYGAGSTYGTVRAAIFATPAQTLTVLDSGDGSPAAATLTPTSGLVAVTCSDADGCDLTLGESGIVDGQTARVTNASANAVNLADTAGVSELTGAIALGQYDAVTLIYRTDRWIQTAPVANN